MSTTSVSTPVWHGPGTASARARRMAHWYDNANVSRGLNFVAAAAHSQGSDTDSLARSGADLVAGTALSQGQVQISWQAQHFRKAEKERKREKEKEKERQRESKREK